MNTPPPFEFSFYPPSPHLSAYISGYWNIRSTASRGDSCIIYRALPDGCSNIVFNLADSIAPLEGSSAPIPAGAAIFAGLADWHMRYRMAGAVDLFGIRFRREYLRELLHCDLHEIIGGQIALSELFGADAEQMQQQLICEAFNHRRISIVERLLAGRCAGLKAPNPVLLSIIDAVASNTGARCVTAIKRDAGVSERQMERICAQHIGLSPKHFAEVMRFWRSSVMLQTGMDTMEIVDVLGFADHAHFCRTFRRYAGISPGAYVKEQQHVGFVQDSDLSHLLE